MNPPISKIRKPYHAMHLQQPILRLYATTNSCRPSYLPNGKNSLVKLVFSSQSPSGHTVASHPHMQSKPAWRQENWLATESKAHNNASICWLWWGMSKTIFVQISFSTLLLSLFTSLLISPLGEVTPIPDHSTGIHSFFLNFLYLQIPFSPCNTYIFKKGCHWCCGKSSTSDLNRPYIYIPTIYLSLFL